MIFKGNLLNFALIHENLLLHFEVVSKQEVNLKSRKGGDGMSINVECTT